MLLISCTTESGGGDGEVNPPAENDNINNPPSVESTIGYVTIKNNTTSVVYIYEDGDSLRTKIKTRVPANSEYTIESKTGVVTYYYSFMIDVGGTLIPWYSTDVNSFSAFSVQVSDGTYVYQEISFPNQVSTTSSYFIIKNSSGSAIKVFKDKILLSPVDYPENVLINAGEQYVYEIKQEDFNKTYYIKNAIGTSSYEINQAVGSLVQSKIYTIDFSNSISLVESAEFNKTEYKIEHYLENLDGGYSLYESQIAYGIVGKKTAAMPVSYTGFEYLPFEQVTLDENILTCIKVYYDRKIICLSFDCGPGKLDNYLSKESIFGKFGTQIFYAREPARDYYDFIGWDEMPSIFPECDLTIYAKWHPVTYDIVYYSNGGENSADNPVSYTVEADTISLANASRPGYRFDGWYSSNAYSTKITEIQSGSNGTVKLYAKWTPEKYTITYHLNGGTNNASNPAVYNIETDGIKLQSPIRNNYIFGGWYSDASFSNPSATVSAGSTGNKEFHAKWTPVTYLISYDLGGGTNHTANPTEYTVESGSIVLKTPSRKGYEFKGWYSESDFINRVEVIPDGTNGDRNFYAKWMPITYPIVYHLDGGVNSDSNPSKFNIETDTIYFTSPYKSGYTFAGWYEDSGFTRAVDNTAKGTTGNMELYAKWLPNSLSVDVVMPENYKDIAGLKYSEMNGVLQIEASAGYESYIWYFDDVKMLENSNVYSVDTILPSVKAGVHFVMVVVKDHEGRTYSAQLQLIVRK